MVIDAAIGRADAEAWLVEACIDQLRSKEPIAFPSRAEIEQLASAVHTLRVAIARSAAIMSLIAAGEAVVETRPEVFA